MKVIRVSMDEHLCKKKKNRIFYAQLFVYNNINVSSLQIDNFQRVKAVHTFGWAEHRCIYKYVFNEKRHGNFQTQFTKLKRRNDMITIKTWLRRRGWFMTTPGKQRRSVRAMYSMRFSTVFIHYVILVGTFIWIRTTTASWPINRHVFRCHPFSEMYAPRIRFWLEIGRYHI